MGFGLEPATFGFLDLPKREAGALLIQPPPVWALHDDSAIN